MPTLLDLSLPLRCFKLTAELGLFASETEGIRGRAVLLFNCYLVEHGAVGCEMELRREWRGRRCLVGDGFEGRRSHRHEVYL